MKRLKAEGNLTCNATSPSRPRLRRGRSPDAMTTSEELTARPFFPLSPQTWERARVRGIFMRLEEIAKHRRRIKKTVCFPLARYDMALR